MNGAVAVKVHPKQRTYAPSTRRSTMCGRRHFSTGRSDSNDGDQSAGDDALSKQMDGSARVDSDQQVPGNNENSGKGKAAKPSKTGKDGGGNAKKKKQSGKEINNERQVRPDVATPNPNKGGRNDQSKMS